MQLCSYRSAISELHFGCRSQTFSPPPPHFIIQVSSKMNAAVPEWSHPCVSYVRRLDKFSTTFKWWGISFKRVFRTRFYPEIRLPVLDTGLAGGLPGHKKKKDSFHSTDTKHGCFVKAIGISKSRSQCPLTSQFQATIRLVSPSQLITCARLYRPHFSACSGIFEPKP